MRYFFSPFFRLTAVSVFLLSTSTVYASAFQIWEQSAYDTGDYHAGAAAECDDASLEFYNPAQITCLQHQQISLGAVVIPVEASFSGTVDGPGNLAAGSSNTINVVPNIHYVAPLSDRWYFSFGATTPFGLETDYTNADALTQYAATETELLTENLNPSLAFKVTDWMSIGAGFDMLYGMADYNNAIPGEDTLKNSLSGWGYGYNAGVFFKFPIFNSLDPTQIGVSYRSKISVNASGSSSFESTNSTASTELNLPATTIASVYQPVNNWLAVMGSAFYTQWNVFSVLTLNNVVNPDNSLQPTINIPVYENYSNTWNFALGTHIKLTSNFTLKFGGGYDQTPTTTGYRDIRLPDVSHYALSTGFHWQLWQSFGFDLGYTHIFSPNANIDNTLGAASDSVIPNQVGIEKVSANVYGGQISWTF